jgi:aspyridone synthetase (hybrid polyketide synthase/nonribosomal peptide synthetase)
MAYAEFTSKAYGFGQIRVLQQTSIGFDLSFAQIYSAFTNGGMLVVSPVEARGDPEMLSKLIVEENIEYTMCTPSEYSLLLTYAEETLQQCHTWRYAGTAGEVLPERLIDGMRSLKLPNLTLVDCYGPAEAFIVTSRNIPVQAGAGHDTSKDKVGSIGHVLPNTSVYIISEHDGSLLPPGMPGEICIGGIGVANGYLDPEMGDVKFVKNPFTTDKYTQQGFDNMYKSGDRGILHEDGSVIFLGRANRHNAVVKLRGLRVDLREVTGAVLKAAPDDFSDAAVTIRGDPQFLVCHVVLKHGKSLNSQQLVGLLNNISLPHYIIPSVIVPLERLPVTSNGKLDVATLEGLPLPEVSEQTQNKIKVTETGVMLRKIWIDVIGAVAKTGDIGPNTSFFEVGGNSLLLVHLQHTINAKFGVKIPLRLLGQASALRAMAFVVEKELS